MIHSEALSDGDKLLIVASGFGFVAFVLAATVCIVQPTCFVHRRLWGKRERGMFPLQLWNLFGSNQPPARWNSYTYDLIFLISLCIERAARIKAAKQMGIPIPLAVLSTDLRKSQPSLTEDDGEKKEATTTFAFQRGGVRDSTYSSMSSGSRGDNSIIVSLVCGTFSRPLLPSLGLPNADAPTRSEWDR